MFTFEHCKITPLAVCNHYVVSVEIYACSKTESANILISALIRTRTY